MDLKCKLKSRHGKTQWAEGYQITVGLDGIARNVPEIASKKLLTNPAVWEVFTGKATPPPPGIIAPLSGIGMLPQLGIPVQTEPQVVEVSLVPRSLGLLEGLAPELLGVVAAQFDIDAALVENVPRAIIDRADEQLSAQLARFVEMASSAPGGDSSSEDPPPPAPAPEVPPAAPQGLAVVPGPAMPPAPPAAATPATAVAAKKTVNATGKGAKAKGGDATPEAPPVVAPVATVDDTF